MWYKRKLQENNLCDSDEVIGIKQQIRKTSDELLQLQSMLLDETEQMSIQEREDLLKREVALIQEQQGLRTKIKQVKRVPLPTF